jgi:rare lipoprotein A
MKRIILFTIASLAFSSLCAAQVLDNGSFTQEGIASWYGAEFEGRPTASGEIFSTSQFTAAHPTLPFGTTLMITNKHNGKTVIVRVNDRGPFVAARIIDLSQAAARQLDMIKTGTAPVLVETISAAQAAANTAPPAAISRVNDLPQPGRVQIDQSQTDQGQAWQIQPEQRQADHAQVTQAPEQVQMSQTHGSRVKPLSELPPAVIRTETPVPAAPAPVQPAAISQPWPVQPPARAAAPAQLKGAVPGTGNAKLYRVQVGAYAQPRNAVETFEKLKNAGLNPAYEKFNDFYRVVISGIAGGDVQDIAEKLGQAGFREAILKEEN